VESASQSPLVIELPISGNLVRKRIGSVCVVGVSTAQLKLDPLRKWQIRDEGNQQLTVVVPYRCLRVKIASRVHTDDLVSEGSCRLKDVRVELSSILAVLETECRTHFTSRQFEKPPLKVQLRHILLNLG